MMFALLVGCAAFYAARLLFFVSGFLRQRSIARWHHGVPRVSVIVPARNEEANLRRCIDALMRTDYPQDAIEFIMVNDRSTDGTAEELQKLTASDGRFVLVNKTDDGAHTNLRGKPGALQAGIDRATGDLLMMTDADCVIHPQWVRSMAAPFADDSVGMVCGFTTIRTRSFFHALQDVEWLYSQAMAKGGVGNHVPLGCYGNNIAIRRWTYDHVGGYAAIPFSITEDLALLQRVSDHDQEVIYQCRREATVETLPCVTLAEYVRQRQRWARGGTALGNRALIFVLSSVAVWFGIVTSALRSDLQWLLIFVCLRVLGDSILVAIAAVRLRRYRILPFIVPSIIMLMMTELAAPFLTLRTNVVWKGQVFKT